MKLEKMNKFLRHQAIRIDRRNKTIETRPITSKKTALIEKFQQGKKVHDQKT